MFTVKKDMIEYENKSLRLPTDLIEKVQKLASENNVILIEIIEEQTNRDTGSN